MSYLWPVTHDLDLPARRLWRDTDQMPPLSGSALLQRIEADLPSLSPQLYKVADYLVRERGLPLRHRITDFAQLTGTAPVTIVRLAKRYGFQGFYELKVAFLAQDGDATGVADVAEDLLGSLQVPQANALSALRPLVDDPVFMESARWLHEADVVWVSGLRPADRPLAECVVQALQHIGLMARSASRACPPSTQCVHLQVALTPSDANEKSWSVAAQEGRRIVLTHSRQPGIAREGHCLRLAIGMGTAGEAQAVTMGLLAAWAGAMGCLRNEP